MPLLQSEGSFKNMSDHVTFLLKTFQWFLMSPKIPAKVLTMSHKGLTHQTSHHLFELVPLQLTPFQPHYCPGPLIIHHSFASGHLFSCRLLPSSPRALCSLALINCFYYLISLFIQFIVHLPYWNVNSTWTVAVHCWMPST